MVLSPGALCRLVDVSHFLEDFIFPGNPSFSRNGPHNRVSGNNREFVYDLSFCTQSGTHIQGPHYFLEHGKTIDLFPIETFEGPCLIIDLEKRGSDTTAEDLQALIRPEEGALPILILRTGHMDEVLANGVLDPERRPGLSPDAATFLAEETSFRLVGIDSVGLESRKSQNFEVNLYLCRKGILLLEGLVNLFAVRNRIAFLHAFPLKTRGVEGTPCRAVIRDPAPECKDWAEAFGIRIERGRETDDPFPCAPRRGR
jgi:arylformamidase